MNALTDDQAEKLIELFRETLPHGSGIDAKWEFNFFSSKIEMTNSFHIMDENGFYDGWEDFKVTLTLPAFTWEIKMSKRLNEQCGDYLWECIRHGINLAKPGIASHIGVALIPHAERRLIEISLQGWRGDIIKRFGHYGDWPQWAKDVSKTLNDTCATLDNLTAWENN